MLKRAWIGGAARARGRPLTPPAPSPASGERGRNQSALFCSPRPLAGEGLGVRGSHVRNLSLLLYFSYFLTVLPRSAEGGLKASGWERVQRVRFADPSPVAPHPLGSQKSVTCAPLPLAEGRRNQLFAPLSRSSGEGPRRGGEGLSERTQKSVVCAPLLLAGRGSPKGG